MKEKTQLIELLALAEALLCECRIWILYHGDNGAERADLVWLIDDLEQQINEVL